MENENGKRGNKMPTLSYFPSSWAVSVLRYTSRNRSVTGYETITRRTV